MTLEPYWRSLVAVDSRFFLEFLHEAENEPANAVTRDKGFKNYSLGYCYEFGLGGVLKDLPKAARWYHRGAEAGYAEAQARLGHCYEQGYGVDKNYTKARHYYYQSAIQGHTQGERSYAYCYLRGFGIPKSGKIALEWAQKAANKGHPDAMNIVGLCYLNDGEIRDVPKMPEIALEWFMKAAELGYAKGQNNVGFCYEKGYGTKENKQLAFYWFMKAAEGGYDFAQYNVGCCYDNGIGVPQDKTTALYWFKKAAEQNFESAQYWTAYFLQNGYGCSKDIKEAKLWYEKAAEKGYKEAQYQLALLLQDDKSDDNRFLAAKYFAKAAEQKCAKSIEAIMKPELNNIIIANNWPESFEKLHPKCQISVLTVFACFHYTKFGESSSADMDSTDSSSDERIRRESGEEMEVCSLIEEIGEVPHELLLIITKMMLMLWPKEEGHTQYYTKVEEKKEVPVEKH